MDKRESANAADTTTKGNGAGHFRGTPFRIFGVVFVVWLLWLYLGFVWVGWASLPAWLPKAFLPPWSGAANVVVGADPTLAKGGQFGDWFGGLNALFTALALGAVIWSSQMQRHAMKEQERLFNEQQKEIRRQSFESSLFQMISLCRELHEGLHSTRMGGIERRMTGIPQMEVIHSYGAEAVEHFVASSLSILTKVRDQGAVDAHIHSGYRAEIGKRFDSSVYNTTSSQLGPYFRALYHLFELIDGQTFLDRRERRRYANVARDHLSENHLILLAMSLCTERSGNMLTLVEKFGLLRHMPHQPPQLELLRQTLPAKCFDGDPRLN